MHKPSLQASYHNLTSNVFVIISTSKGFVDEWLDGANEDGANPDDRANEGDANADDDDNEVDTRVDEGNKEGGKVDDVNEDCAVELELRVGDDPVGAWPDEDEEANEAGGLPKRAHCASKGS